MKVKYKWVYAIEELFVDLIVDSFWKFDVPEFDLVVPVPLHSRRRRWRGFNQSEILAKTIADKFSLNYQEILVRIRETKTQVGLKADERLENIKGAFSYAKIRSGGKKIIDSKNILLVDDVYTSGATMGEASRELKKAGVGEVWGLTVALG